MIPILNFISRKNHLLNFSILINERDFNKLDFKKQKLEQFNNNNLLIPFIFDKKSWDLAKIYHDFEFNNFSYIGTDLYDLTDLLNYKSEFKKQFYSIHTGPINKKYCNLHEPIDGRPVDFNGLYYNVWFQEYGLFNKIDKNQRSLGFFHPITGLLIMRTEKEFSNIKKKLRNLSIMKNYNKVKFLRVISVYDKFKKNLKYQIINDFFSIIPLSTLMDHYENDELFLRSYEITPDIYKNFVIVVNEALEFDFNKNSYFFETITADELIFKVK